MKTAGVDLYNASVTKQFGTGGSTTTTTMQQQQQQKMEEDGDAIIVNCRICYDQFTSASDVFSLGCKHSFCRSCYGDYLDNQIREGQLCIIARCPEFKCLQTVTESVFQKLADPSLKMNYDRYMLRNFIETYKNMKHCPAPGMMYVDDDDEYDDEYDDDSDDDSDDSDDRLEVNVLSYIVY